MTKEYVVTVSLPQGTTLGPLLWNLKYDKVLGLRVSEEVTLICFVDDQVAMVVGKHSKDVTLYESKIIHAIKETTKRRKRSLLPIIGKTILSKSRLVIMKSFQNRSCQIDFQGAF